MSTRANGHLAKLEEHAPRARCYKCGSTAVADLCHHCGKTICRDDSPATQDILGRPRSFEFTGLNIRNAGPVHCNTCFHVVRRRYLTFRSLSAAIAAVGAVIAPLTIAVGASLVVAGTVLAVCCYFADRREQAHPKHTPPPLPLVPNIDEIRVLETLHGKLSLDEEGNYTNPVTSAQGEISISMTLGWSDRLRLERYIRKYRVRDANDVEFCAGFALLCGPARLTMEAGGHNKAVIPLTGRVRDVPFLQRGRIRPTKQWPVERRYQPDLDYRSELKPETESPPEPAPASQPQQGHIVPISLSPAVVAESGQRELELQLQWLKLRPPESTFAIDRIESLILKVPVAWGDVELVTGRAAAGIGGDASDGDSAVRTIEWTRIPLGAIERTQRRLRLAIKFEHKIEMSHTIRGQVQVNFKGTLSDLEDVDIYHPLGELRSEKLDVSIATRVLADFELSLQKIRYQDTRVVPDPDFDGRKLCGADKFEDVTPDHKTIITLTNAISEDGYYVKRVIENPPRSGGRSDLLNRYWDIAGRRYDGVFPIDFHITLTGEEKHAGDIGPYAGNLQARVTVQGAYATQEMADQIRAQWDSLHRLVLKELNGLRPDPDEVFLEGNGGTSPGPNRAYARGQEVKYIRVLRTLLSHLDDALRRNLISQEAYWNMRMTIERELEEQP